MKLLKGIIFLSLAAFLFQCATVPISGRSQLSLISNAEIIPMSINQYKEVITASKLSGNREQTDLVKKVGIRIQKAVETYMKENGHTNHLQGFEWEYNLIENDTMVNAWCMPGGKVAFYTGIMPICKDEAGIAVVMGHEVAHAIANHGRERMSQGMLTNGVLGSVSAAMSQNPTATKQILMQSIGAGTQLGILSFSRKHESESDKLGLIFMAMAGYNPKEAPKFWERMAALSQGKEPLEWMSTHPSNATRISDLNKQLPEALKIYEKNKGQN